MNKAEQLRILHSNPDFAAARDQRGRDRFTARQKELQCKSMAARRGVDVPPHLEDDWKALKKKRFSNEEAASLLGLKIRGRPHKEAQSLGQT